MNSIKARWVFPGSSEPIPNATVRTTDGVIEAIHSTADPNSDDLGNVAIIPGLINAHTHLEFSDLRQPLPPGDFFTDWIQSVVAHRRSSDTDVEQTIQAGIAECVASGTTTIGEIATRDGDLSFSDSASNPAPRIVAFRECISALPAGVGEQLEIAANHVSQNATDRFIPALSPHAPYTVHRDLFFGLTELARKQSVPIAMHLFETTDELQFLQHASGPFVEMLQKFGVWDESRSDSMLQPADYLRELATCPHGLIVHGNYLTPDECQFIAQHQNLSVVYCPRTHSHFQHTAHPWLDLLQSGANVTVGTDSRASNPNLSVFDELKWLASRFPEVARSTLLKMATVNAAAALGLDGVGTLQAGSAAEMTIVKLPDVAGEPWELLFHPDSKIVS